MSLKRLTENFSIGPENIRKPNFSITESNGFKLVEDINGVQRKCYGVYSVPVSRYDWLNENGRSYPKALWEKVINDQKEVWDGGIGLANHPIDENNEDVQKIFGVWKNLRLNEKLSLVEADIYLVGPPGKHASEILEAGGRIGFSSSGFGELDESDNSTVNPQTYILERVSDWVLNPSQRVYGSINNKSQAENTIIKESSELPESNILKESVPMPSTFKMSKIEMRKFVEDTEKWISEANQQKDLKEKKEFLEEILSYFPEKMEGKVADLHTNVTLMLQETSKEIDKAIVEFTRVKESFGVDEASKLEEGLTNILVDTKLHERNAKEWESLAKALKEELQKSRMINEELPTNEDYNTLLENNKKVTSIFAEKEAQLLGYIESLNKALEEEKANNAKLMKQAHEIWESKNIISSRLERTMKVAESLKAKLDEETMPDMPEEAPAPAPSEGNGNMDITEEGVIAVRPRKAPPKIFEGFNEGRDVAKYVHGLELTYGKGEIAPFKETLISKKTVDESRRAFLRIFSEMDSKSTTRLDDAITGEARRQLIEGQTGKIINQSVMPLSNKLKTLGWE